jgi:hypothetical protein
MLSVTIGGRTAMSTFRLLGAVVILSAAIATPAPAQQVISEPGYCAQFYPNANCQNKGPNNPYTGSYQRNLEQSNGMWTGDQTVGVTGKRSRTHRSNSAARQMQ